MDKVKAKALTFDDVLLVPSYCDFLPSQASVKTSLTKNIDINLPLLSAAMDTVTEYRMAIALAEAGGIGICLLYTSPSPRDVEESRMPSSA